MSVGWRMTKVEFGLFFFARMVLIPFLMSLMLCYAIHVHIPARPYSVRQAKADDDGRRFLRGICGWDRGTGLEMKKNKP